MKQINTQALQKVLVLSADLIIRENPRANYDADTTPELEIAANEMIANYGLDQSYIQQIMIFRDSFEKSLRKNYKVKYNSLLQNIQSEYTKRGVPQRAQVISGILDLLIGSIMMNAQENVMFEY